MIKQNPYLVVSVLHKYKISVELVQCFLKMRPKCSASVMAVHLRALQKKKSQQHLVFPGGHPSKC